MFDGAAGTFLGYLLRDTLLVLAAVEDSPCDPSGVLALEKKGFGLSVDKTENLGVASYVDLTLGRVDFAAYSQIFD